MSKALCCDHCEATLPLNARGDHEGGEDAAWIELSLANDRFDLCSRSCAIEFLQRPEVIEAQEEWLETITGIARTIRDAGDGQGKS